MTMKLLTREFVKGEWGFGFGFDRYLLDYQGIRKGFRITLTFAKWFVSLNFEPKMKRAA